MGAFNRVYIDETRWVQRYDTVPTSTVDEASVWKSGEMVLTPMHETSLQETALQYEYASAMQERYLIGETPPERQTWWHVIPEPTAGETEDRHATTWRNLVAKYDATGTEIERLENLVGELEILEAKEEEARPEAEGNAAAPVDTEAPKAEK